MTPNLIIVATNKKAKMLKKLRCYTAYNIIAPNYVLFVYEFHLLNLVILMIK